MGADGEAVGRPGVAADGGGPPSRLQLTTAAGSLTVKLTVAVVELLEATGPAVMVTVGLATGGAVTVQL